MHERGLNRRQFLKATGFAAAGMIIGSGYILTWPRSSYAGELKSLTQHEADTLLRMCRYAYPHPTLGDMYYAPIVQGFDDKASKDANLAKQLKEGVAQLDSVYPPKWINMSPGYQMKALMDIQSSPFFQTVRGTTVAELYNNKLLWGHFGYEGSSFEFGGYLTRGFDDINWLPKL